MSHALRRSLLIASCALGCSVSQVVYEPDPPPTTTAAPVFNGAAVQADTPPPPLVGGTVRIVRSGGAAFAVASDPEEDVVDVVSLGPSPALVGTVALQRGDEPNRIVGDSHGFAHVVLRGGGAIATIDPTTASLVQRRPVCPAPRGIDYDPTSDSLYVACATGELVTLPSNGPPSRVVRLDRDLRDVVVSGNQLFVTRFRSAERLALDASGAVVSRDVPAGSADYSYSGMSPVVAWRTVKAVSGGTIMLHQLASDSPLVVVPQQTYYAETGGVISASAVAVDSAASTPLAIEQAIDVTVDEQGTPEILSLLGTVQTGAGSVYNANLVTLPPSQSNGYYGYDNTYQYVGIDDGASIGVPYKVVQRRAPTALLEIFKDTFTATPALVTLPQKSKHLDTGFDIFNIPTSVGTACMNCHPEGGDDGHTWRFSFTTASGGSEVRIRRTQSLRGGVVTDTAPYHWDGDLSNLQDLCNEVFTHRMGGGQIEPAQASILARWLNAVPRVPVRDDLDQKRVAAGKALFDGPAGCASCHVGGTGVLAQNQIIGKIDSLGASKPTQVPSLLDVADRAPYMHDGCAASLMDRLTDPNCGGSMHGNTSTLSADDLQSLETYLESL
jgi:mono/diheme cytochrome c family protein